MSGIDTELNAELTEIFREEAITRLDQMDAALLAMESGDAGAETIDSLFRNAHTIKGSAAMLGFDDVRALAYAVEDVLARVRETGVFPAELAEPLLRATAALRAQVTGTAGPIDDLLEDLAAGSAAASASGDIRAPGPSAPRMGIPGRGPEVAGPEVSGPEVSGPEVPGPSVAELRVPEPKRPEPKQSEPKQSERRTLRVPAEKIDHLLDVVGEVMQQRRRLAHSLTEEARQSPEIADALGGGDRML